MNKREVYYINNGEFRNFLRKIALSHSVFAPQQGLFDLEFTGVTPEATENIIFPGARLTQPLKFFLYPPREMVTSDPLRPEKKRVLLGVKACDLHAAAILDRIYLDPEIIDPFYRQRREDTIIISDDCPAPAESCFCVLVGGNPFPEKDFDLNLSFLDEGVVVEVGSEKGKALLEDAEVPRAPAEEKHLSQRLEERSKVAKDLREGLKEYQFQLEGLPDFVEAQYESPKWKEACETCVSCNACTNICPSCHCFLIAVARPQETPGHGAGDSAGGSERVFEHLRLWDSCQSAGFSRVAGRANGGKKITKLFENRFLCKFRYKPKNYGLFACTGCGRCYEACQGKIDVRHVLTLLSGSVRD